MLAASLRPAESIAAGLRQYEARRRQRARFVIATSWRLGRVFQWTNPIATRLRDGLSSTSWARQREAQIFARLLYAELPDLTN